MVLYRLKILKNWPGQLRFRQFLEVQNPKHWSEEAKNEILL